VEGGEKDGIAEVETSGAVEDELQETGRDVR